MEWARLLKSKLLSEKSPKLKSERLAHVYPKSAQADITVGTGEKAGGVGDIEGRRLVKNVAHADLHTQPVDRPPAKSSQRRQGLFLGWWLPEGVTERQVVKEWR